LAGGFFSLARLRVIACTHRHFSEGGKPFFLFGINMPNPFTLSLSKRRARLRQAQPERV
jgi:hypothetical protein